MGCCIDSREVPPSVKAAEKLGESKRSEMKTRGKFAQETPQMSHPEVRIRAGQFVQKLTGPISNTYRIIKKLGKGSFGEVSLGEHKQTGQLRAIKELRKNTKLASSSNPAKFIDEVFLLSQINHPHVLKIYELYETSNKYFIVSEVLSGGELLDYIVKSKQLSEGLAAKVMFQLLSAVSYCHERQIMHRDLKPENLLLESPPKNNEISIKIIDFGTSCLFSHKEKLKQKLGTPFYVAPEILQRDYNEKCDLWSCGVILYILLSGTPPFPGKTDIEILENVAVGKYEFPQKHWKGISEDAKNLIRQLLVLDYTNRISAEQALCHPWIQLHHKTSSLNSDLIQTSLINLISFRSEQKLKTAIMAYIAAQYVTKEQTKALTESFKGLDRNGDGKLSREELTNGYMEILSEDEALETVTQIMQTVDADGSGYIDYSEFIVAAINQQTLLSKNNLETAFNSIDSDNSGKISQQEMREMLSMGVEGNDEVWRKLIAEADIDGDGEIDLVEFMKLMLHQTVL